MKIRQAMSWEWDAIAGIAAAFVAIVLHLLHIVDETVVLPILLALVGLLFINFMRHSRNNELTAEQVERMGHTVDSLHAALERPGLALIGPRQLQTAYHRFLLAMSGDSIWFNVCLSMYRTPALFDALLRPAIDNPAVGSIQFVLDESQRELWDSTIAPQIAACAGHARVRPPRWCKLERTLSFILADSQHSGSCEALLSFWGEPFMAQATGRDVPRFVFHVQQHSELLPHLLELEGCSAHFRSRTQ